MLTTTRGAAMIAALLCVAASGAAQEDNVASGSLDINGSSGSGSAPYSASITLPGPLVLSVSGNADMPFLLVEGSQVDVANTVYPNAGQIDVGPSPQVIVDGISGPYFPVFGNTGCTGTITFQAALPTNTMPVGSVYSALQAVVVDFTLPSPYVAMSAATAVTFTSAGAGNATPAAYAGLNRYEDGNTCVMLDGTGSVDPEMASLTYAWTQICGTAVTLDDATSATPSFIAPAGPDVLVFELTVDDGNTTSPASQVTIGVRSVVATVSFASDVHPIFSSRGCSGCHPSSGSLDLSGTPSQVHAELLSATVDAAFNGDPRANACDPAGSAVLLKPLDTGQGGVSHGGGNIFADTSDADYVTIFTWLMEGAQNN